MVSELKVMQWTINLIQSHPGVDIRPFVAVITEYSERPKATITFIRQE